MRYLTLGEVVTLHRALIASSGGADGIRDLGALDSALAQPKATFGAADLYPTAIEKACALAFGLALNHPFIDGNKRIARGPCRRCVSSLTEPHQGLVVSWPVPEGRVRERKGHACASRQRTPRPRTPS